MAGEEGQGCLLWGILPADTISCMCPEAILQELLAEVFQLHHRERKLWDISISWSPAAYWVWQLPILPAYNPSGLLWNNSARRAVTERTYMHAPSYPAKPTDSISSAQLTSALLPAETCPEQHQKPGKIRSPALTPTATKLPLHSLPAPHEKHIPHFCYTTQCCTHARFAEFYVIHRKRATNVHPLHL